MAYQLLTAKPEVTPGTEIANLAADSLWVENVSHKLMGERFVMNPAQPGLGANPGVIYGQHVEISFELILAGSGTAGVAPKWGKLLKAAGWAETVVATTSVAYTRLPDPETSSSLSMVWNEEGRKHKALYARGKADVMFAKGSPPKLKMLYRAIHVPVAARAPVVPADADFGGWEESPVIQQAFTTFTMGGVALPLLELSANGADNVKFIDLPGMKKIKLAGDPSYSGKIKALQPAIGAYNPEAKALANTREPWSVVHNTVAGKILTVAGVAQLGLPAWSQVDEGDSFECDASFVGSSGGATDDLIITLT